MFFLSSRDFKNCQLLGRNGIYGNGASENVLSIWELPHVRRSL